MGALRGGRAVRQIDVALVTDVLRHGQRRCGIIGNVNINWMGREILLDPRSVVGLYSGHNQLDSGIKESRCGSRRRENMWNERAVPKEHAKDY